jgi:hypothetical protein
MPLRGHEALSTPLRRLKMAKAVQWETDMDKALSRAKAENKELLLDFFNPG